MDSRFHVLDSGICQSNFEFWIPVFNGIPDSLSCFPDFKAQDSGFYTQNFPLFWIPQAAKIFPILLNLETGFSYIGRNNAEIAHLHHPFLHFFHGQKHSLVHIRLHLHSLHIFLNFLNATEMHVLFDHFNETLARKVHGFFYKFRRGLK